jgi:hypothetical protein
MAEFMHQEVMRATMAIVGAICYVVFNYDEMSTMDN